MSEELCFAVLYGPYKPYKKHKQWIGDAYLKVTGSNAVLIDQESLKIIGSVKLAKEDLQLEEGNTLVIGPNECEIQNACDPSLIARQPLQPVKPVATKVASYNLSSPYTLSSLKSPLLKAEEKPFLDPLVRESESRRIPATADESQVLKVKKFFLLIKDSFCPDHLDQQTILSM